MRSRIKIPFWLPIQKLEHTRRGRDANERDHLKGGIFHRGFRGGASAYAKRWSTRADAGCTRDMEAAAPRRTVGVQELPSSEQGQEYSDFMLMKHWRHLTYCNYYYVHVLPPPFYHRQRDVGEYSQHLPVGGWFIFRWRPIEIGGFYRMQSTTIIMSTCYDHRVPFHHRTRHRKGLGPSDISLNFRG